MKLALATLAFAFAPLATAQQVQSGPYVWQCGSHQEQGDSYAFVEAFDAITGAAVANTYYETPHVSYPYTGVHDLQLCVSRDAKVGMIWLGASSSGGWNNCNGVEFVQLADGNGPLYPQSKQCVELHGGNFDYSCTSPKIAPTPSGGFIVTYSYPDLYVAHAVVHTLLQPVTTLFEAGIGFSLAVQTPSGRIVTSFGWFTAAGVQIGNLPPTNATVLAADMRGLVVGVTGSGIFQSWAQNGQPLTAPVLLDNFTSQSHPSVTLADYGGGLLHWNAFDYRTITQRGKLVP